MKLHKILKKLESERYARSVPTKFKDRFSPFQVDIIRLFDETAKAIKEKRFDKIITYISLIAGRRSGKTTLAATLPGYLTHTYPFWGGNFTYAGFDLKYLKQLYWSEIIKYLDVYRVKYLSNSKDNQITILNNHTNIFFESLKDLASAKKIRGKANKFVLLEESQSVRQDVLQETIEDFAEPSTLDNAGLVMSIGTPPRVHKSSYFLKRHLKSRHHFDGINIHNNPFIPSELAKAFLKKKREDFGLKEGEESPSFLREYLGEMIEDRETLVFNLTEGHLYDKLPDPISKANYVACAAIDIGWNDKDALCVLLYHPKSGSFFLDYEFEKSEQLTETFAGKIRSVLHEKYHPLLPMDIVGDAGGGGKKVIHDMNNKEKLWITPAIKHNKEASIKLLRDAIEAKRFFARRDSIFYKEVDLIAWAETMDKIDDKTYHSDILDAILYAMRMLSYRM